MLLVNEKTFEACLFTHLTDKLDRSLEINAIAMTTQNHHHHLQHTGYPPPPSSLSTSSLSLANDEVHRNKKYRKERH